MKCVLDKNTVTRGHIRWYETDRPMNQLPLLTRRRLPEWLRDFMLYLGVRDEPGDLTFLTNETGSNPRGFLQRNMSPRRPWKHGSKKRSRPLFGIRPTGVT